MLINVAAGIQKIIIIKKFKTPSDQSDSRLREYCGLKVFDERIGLFKSNQSLLSKCTFHGLTQNRLRFVNAAVWTPTYELVVIHSFGTGGGHVPGVHLVISILCSWSITAWWYVVSGGTTGLVFLPCDCFVMNLQLEQQLYSSIDLSLNKHIIFCNYEYEPQLTE